MPNRTAGIFESSHSIAWMPKEFDIWENSIVILDRGFCGKKVLGEITYVDHGFVVAANRNNAAYGTTAEKDKAHREAVQ